MNYPDGTSLLITIINAVDAQGNPTTPTGVVWTTSDSTVFTPVAAADGLSATGTVQKVSSVTVTATDGGGISSSVTFAGVVGMTASFSLQVATVPAAPPATPPAA